MTTTIKQKQAHMKVTVTAPLCVGNIVCGFDVLGMVLDEAGETIEISLREDDAITIRHLDNFGLPEDPEQNVVGVALRAVQQALDQPVGFDVIITKTIPPGSGLGSSAASAAGAVVAANELLGKRFSKDEMVWLAMQGEHKASGGWHADNIAPCIYGGINLIRSIDPIEVTVLPIPDVFVTAVHPFVQIKTSEARSILPKEVSLHKATEQWANVGALVASFYRNDLALLGHALEDVLIEPVRKKLIPHFDEVKQRCLTAGAIGGGISGSGPAIFMLSASHETAMAVEEEMKQVFTKAAIAHKTYLTTINPVGVKIIS